MADEKDRKKEITTVKPKPAGDYVRRPIIKNAGLWIALGGRPVDTGR